MKKQFIEQDLSVSIRSGENNEQIVFGYAATYGTRSKMLFEGGKRFYEEVLPGAFETGLDNSADTRALIDHDKALLLGRVKSGTLSLRADERGLYFELTLPNTQRGRDLGEQIERGDVSELSFAFMVRNSDFTWSRTETGELLRKISDFYKITDISLLQGEPAYYNTSMSMRDYDDVVEKLEHEETAERQHLDNYYKQIKESFYE